MRYSLIKCLPVLAALLGFTGCLPSAYLQKYAVQGLNFETPVSVCEPEKNIRGEFGAGLSFAGPQKFSLVQGSYLRQDTTVDSGMENVFYTRNPFAFKAAFGINGPGLFHGLVDVRASYNSGNVYWDAILGLGVRLYNDVFGGTIHFLAGFSRFSTDIYAIEHTAGADIYSSEYHDLFAKKFETRPFLGLTATINGLRSPIPFYPLVHIGARYTPMFAFEEINIDLATIDIGAGFTAQQGLWRLNGIVCAAYTSGISFGSFSHGAFSGDVEMKILREF